MSARALLGAKVQAAKKGDAEAKAAADDYCRLLRAIEKEKVNLSADRYRRISGPLEVMRHEGYQICALAPSADMLDRVEKQLGQLRADLGFSVFGDDEGGFLNDLSVVLHISFGRSEILLLGDAQGAKDDMHPSLRKFAVLKVAHHGSENGLAASLITDRTVTRYNITQAMMTPYKRCGLPRGGMVKKYRTACKGLALTHAKTNGDRFIVAPGLLGGELALGNKGWIGFEISPGGSVKPCKCAV